MKIFINDAKEDWIVDRFKKEFSENNPILFTDDINDADIIWIISPWSWKNVSKKHLKEKKVLCTVHHVDFDKFVGKEKRNFYRLDKFVNVYHTISDKSFEQLVSLTTKKIYNFPFWVNSKLWFHIPESTNLKLKYKIPEDRYVLGSFQRDTEGKDGVSPKLSKGPDRFIQIIRKIAKKREIFVLLTGYRRQYIIKLLEKYKIEYIYYEKVSFEELNELYNCLDLYIVSSRVEGGPQSIFECGLSKTPIISTDVGIAKKILATESIFDMENFENAKANVEFAYQNSVIYDIPKGFEKFNKMFKDIL
tara:strand:- start:448 stop:1362 length:915 start_codon:yes stop_codon:yes gene_type:complete